MRVDYNAPLKKSNDGVISVADNSRIVASLPTIEYLLKQGAKSIVLMSHLGRPDGVHVAELSLKPVAKELSALLQRPVQFLEDCVGEKVETACTVVKGGN